MLAEFAGVEGYRFIHPLKEAGGITSWCCLRQLDGRKVLLKAAFLDAPRRLHFQQQAQLLQEFDPNIHWSHNGDRVLISRPWLEQPGLPPELEPRLDFILRLFSQVLFDLDRAHTMGLVHGSIQPNNLFPSSQSLQDYALGRAEQFEYCAPELLGLIPGLKPGPAADLYSIGAMLYHYLTGQNVYAGDPAAQMRLDREVPPLRDLTPQLPRALDEICQRLLRKDPARRYQRAAAVAEDLEKLADALKSQGDPELVVGSSDTPVQLHEPGFVVRWAELARLRAHQRGLLLVVGPSGSGKTRLLEERARSWPGPVFRMSGFTPRVPMGLLTQLAIQLIDYCASSPELARNLKNDLHSRRDELASLVPCLGPFLGSSAASLKSPETAEHALEALCAWWRALPPCLLIFDDMQWADDLTWQLLQRHQGPATILAATREAGAETQIDRLELEPLNAQESERLLRSMAGGSIGSEIFTQIQQASAGDLFLTIEMLRGLEEQSGSLRTSRRTALLLRSRLDGLPADCVQLLGYAAVMGRQFELKTLADLKGETAATLRLNLQPALGAQLLWARPSEDTLEFAHDRLREECLQRLPLELRRQLHGRLAEHLEQQGMGEAPALAHHFACSDCPERAFEYALQAAQCSQAQFAYDLAEESYRLALKHLPTDKESRRLTVFVGLAETLLMRGAYDGSRSFFLKAEEMVRTDAHQSAALMARLSYVELSRGCLPEACAFARRGLESLRQPLPFGKWRVGAGLAWQMLRLSVGGLAGTRRCKEQSAREELRLQLLTQFSFLHFFLAKPELMLWAHLLIFNEARRYAPCQAQVCAYQMHSIILASLSFYGAAEKYGSLAIEIAEALRERSLRGRACMHRALGRLLSGRLSDSLEDYEQARLLLGRSIQRWDENVIQQNEIHAFYQLGRFSEAADSAAELYRRAQAQGDRMGIAASLRYWVRCAGGLPHRMVFPEPSEDIVAQLYLLEVKGLQHYFRGQFSAARDKLQQAAALPAPPMEKVWTYAWLTSACRKVGSPEFPVALRQVMKLRGRYPLVQAHALREAGWWEARQGRGTAARLRLEESLAWAGRLGQPYEEGLSLQARAQLGQVFGWETSGDESRSQQIFYQLGAAWNLPPSPKVGPALAERHRQLLELGAPIASSVAPDQVKQRLVEAARVLLRAEQAEVVSRESPLPLVQRALAQGAALIWEDVEQHESEVLAGVRSALACAVNSDLCLYARHTTISQLFDEDDLQLVQFLVSLAAAALENAGHYARRLQREAHFQAIFYGSGLSMLVVDAKAEVREQNDFMAPIGNFYQRLHPDERHRFGLMLAERRQLSFEVRYLGAQGAVLWGQLNISPLEENLSVLTLSDVSYRKLNQVVLFAETERRLLASELHDVVTQPLSGLSLLLQALERESRPELLEKCSLACASLLEKLSRLMGGLRLPPLGGEQLSQALQDLLSQNRMQGGYEIRFQANGDLDRVPELTAIFLYRILQESLQNVTRHAGARLVSIHLQVEEQGVEGSIQDDGCGCNLEELNRSRRHGVRGMRERADLLGGSLVVHSAGRGTRLEFKLPARKAL
ncbi:AAA family ATPase [bacterium]|nr:AAA family ATPase [bacterium]